MHETSYLQPIEHTPSPVTAHIDTTLQPIYRLATRAAAPTLRLSLALILLWIGSNKFLDPTLVLVLLHASIFRLLASRTFVYLLGTLEVVAAVVLAVGRGVRYVALLAFVLFGGTLIMF
jgi:uncharacterized membrane protein YphA (DoxX/SURF4 family)